MKSNELNPKEYFTDLKKRKQKVTDKELSNFYDGCLSLVNKYSTTGQEKIIRKLKFLVDCVEKEKKLIDLGIDSFVYRDDIENYIDNIAKDVVKIIELENYPRDIPDNIVDIIAKTKNIFDKMYVVFTDYTGVVEREVLKENRDKDPILFGTFQKIVQIDNRDSNIMNDRFYFLGDWEDEYCDLTMDKFLLEVGKEKLQKIGTPMNKDNIVDELTRLDDDLRRKNNKEFNNMKKSKKSYKWLKRIFKIK